MSLRVNIRLAMRVQLRSGVRKLFIENAGYDLKGSV